MGEGDTFELDFAKGDGLMPAIIFHFGTYSIRQTKEELAARGIPMRL